MSNVNINSFLESIRELKKDTVSVFLPSISESIDLTTLNLKQQKDIISCIADGVSGIVAFNRILNNIILSASSRNDLTVVDRAPAIIALRVNAHGSSYTSDDEVVDLNEILSRLDKYSPVKESTTEFTHSGITAKVAIPSLSYENSIIAKLEDEVKKNGENNTKNLGSIYIYEIIKYVETLKYKDITIKFNELPIKERINLLENLPLPLNKLIINFIEEIKRKERDLLTIGSVVVDISPGFFDVE